MRLSLHQFSVVHIAVFLASSLSIAEAQDDVTGVAALKRLSLQELMELEVVTGARQAEPLYRSASAISVLTGEDIHRAGVTTIPDALRLVPGMHVAQQNGRSWAISARGFNLVAANKLEVVVDGRSVYTPFFSGTFWDVQETILPDIEQIEVVRGPGGTLWGANAVNGVINIQTKSARDTLGGLTVVGSGTRENALTSVRHGWAIGDRNYARVYGRFLDRDWLLLSTGQQGQADREFFQGGFRTDSYPDERTQITTQGNIYTDAFGFKDRPASSTAVSGGNFLARMRRKTRSGNTLEIQTYWDHTERLIPAIFDEKRNTAEVSLLLNHAPVQRHNLLWGIQARGSWDKSRNIGPQVLIPADKELWLFSALLQDQIVIVPDKLSIAVASRLEHYTYTDFEIQPTVRIAWHPAPITTLWAAASRAVRTPVRIDRDLVSPRSGPPVFRGTDLFDSEKLNGYQLGIRKGFSTRLSMDASTYYNRYNDLRSSERQAGVGSPLTFKNGLQATTYGVEIAGVIAIREQARASIGYSHFRKRMRPEPGAAPLSDPSTLGNDPRHSGFAQFSTELGPVSLNIVARGVGSLPNPGVPGYLTSDVRVAWRIKPWLEWSVVGRDLADKQHPEFGANNPRREEIPRSLYTQVEWKY
jgi:iron complex outermembrane recepter protein